MSIIRSAWALYAGIHFYAWAFGSSCAPGIIHVGTGVWNSNNIVTFCCVLHLLQHWYTWIPRFFKLRYAGSVVHCCLQLLCMVRCIPLLFLFAWCSVYRCNNSLFLVLLTATTHSASKWAHIWVGVSFPSAYPSVIVPILSNLWRTLTTQLVSLGLHVDAHPLLQLILYRYTCRTFIYGI